MFSTSPFHTVQTLFCVLLSATALQAGTLVSAGAAPPQRPNVLLILADDLNDWVGVYGGHPQAQTPALDRFAQRAVRFAQPYVQGPMCGPSRTSFLTGKYPHTPGVKSNYRGSLENFPEAMADPHLFEFFKSNGYGVYGAGKLYHVTKHVPHEQQFTQYGGESFGKGRFGPFPPKKLNYDDRYFDYGAFPERDEDQADHQIANWGINKLNELSNQEEPWVVAVGFYRPHMPLYASQRWFDKYPAETLQLPLIKEDDLEDLPPGSEEMGKSPFKCLSYEEMQTKMIDTGHWQGWVQAYLACVSYVDWEIGRVLEALEASGQADNTIVVIAGDHGWHLGEKFRFEKHTLWEESTRTPLMIAAPGVEGGKVSPRTVSLIDLYPTLMDLCGFATPDYLEGRSLLPLLENPNSEWPHPAITTYQNGWSVRNEDWRYIRYEGGGEELYNHVTDPQEWFNLAPAPENQPIKQELSSHIPDSNLP